MPPVHNVASSSANSSRVISRSNDISIPSFFTNNISQVKEGSCFPESILELMAIFIGSLIVSLVICGIVVKFWAQSQARYKDIQAIRRRKQRQRERRDRHGTRPHFIGGSEEMQRKVTGVSIEGDEEAQIDWVIRPDPLYVRIEDAEARRSARRNSNIHPNAEGSMRKMLVELSPPIARSPDMDLNAESPSRKASGERNPPLARRLDFGLIQSGNSRSDRFSQSGREDIRRVTTSKRFYPLDDKPGCGDFDTRGFLDESGNPHIWRSRRIGEKVPAYHAIPSKRTPAAKYHSYLNENHARHSSASSQPSGEKLIQAKVEADQEKKSSYTASQSAASKSIEKQPATAHPKAISFGASPSVERYQTQSTKSPVRNQSRASPVRSLSFTPYNLARPPLNEAPTVRAVSSAQAQRMAGFTSPEKMAPINGLAGSGSPTRSYVPSPTGFKSYGISPSRRDTRAASSAQAQRVAGFTSPEKMAPISSLANSRSPTRSNVSSPTSFKSYGISPSRRNRTANVMTPLLGFRSPGRVKKDGSGGTANGQNEYRGV